MLARSFFKRCISTAKRDKGFSLLEVLVALAIFSVGVLAVAKLFDTSYRYSGGAKTLNIANRIAETTMERLVSYGFGNVLNDMPDRDGTPGPNYTDVTAGGVTTKTNLEYWDIDQNLTTDTNQFIYTLTVEVQEGYVIDAANSVTANKALVTVSWSEPWKQNRQVQYETYL